MVPLAIISAASQLPAVGSAVNWAEGAGSGILSSIRGLGGGAARDASRKARFDGYYSLASSGSVDAARMLYGGVAHCVSSYELNLYKQGVAQLEAANPNLMARARGMGATWDESTDDNPTALEGVLRGMGSNIRNDVASAVQQLGSGATSAATQAIAAPGSALKSSFLLPTNTTAVIIFVVLLIGAFLYLRKR